MKRALLVGINRYRDPRNNLRGCVNDVINMRNTLKHYGFDEKNMRELTDGRATSRSIINGLHWLIRTAKPGDVLVFHFSGHGSQIRDLNGDEHSDRVDELICPHDMNWKKPFTDDLLRSKFSQLPRNVHMYLFFDCCHSGTMDRSVQDPDAVQEVIPRYLEPPENYRTLNENINLHKIGLKDGVMSQGELRAPTQRHVMVSGCQDNQTSADAWIGGSYNGAFTWNLTKILRNKPKATMNSVYKQTLTALKRSGFTQRPQCWGPKTLLSKPFGTPPK